MMWTLELEQVPFEQDIRELLMAFESSAHVRGRLEGGEYRFETEYEDGEKNVFSCPVREDRFSTKCEVKRRIYRDLAEHAGYELPWGTLTGIRPTKLAMQGMDFQREFLTGEEKTRLCFETAAREQQILSTLPYEKGWSLYLGIPFCPSRCLYCSFTAYPIALWKDKKQQYVKALQKEILAVSELMRGKELQTVYMGGGTPTSLEGEDLQQILETVREVNDMSHVRELTVECGRPDSISREKLQALRAEGVTRICVNPQTMNQKTLDLIGRRHTVEDVEYAFRMARDEGFDNINMDIIAGLPGETVEDMIRTMDRIEALQPDDITVHALALKRAARLNEEKAGYTPQKFPVIRDMIELAHRRCEEMGLHPYYLYRQKNMAGNFENVGYCRPGHEGLYNILIMEEKQTIVGCGAGCSTKIALGEKGVKRIENVKDPQVYIERIDEMIARKRDIRAYDTD